MINTEILLWFLGCVIALAIFEYIAFKLFARWRNKHD